MKTKFKFIDKNNQWHLVTEYENAFLDIYYEQIISAKKAKKINCYEFTWEAWEILRPGYIVIKNNGTK